MYPDAKIYLSAFWRCIQITDILSKSWDVAVWSYVPINTMMLLHRKIVRHQNMSALWYVYCPIVLLQDGLKRANWQNTEVVYTFQYLTFSCRSVTGITTIEKMLCLTMGHYMRCCHKLLITNVGSFLEKETWRAKMRSFHRHVLPLTELSKCQHPNHPPQTRQWFIAGVSVTVATSTNSVLSWLVFCPVINFVINFK